MDDKTIEELMVIAKEAARRAGDFLGLRYASDDKKICSREGKHCLIAEDKASDDIYINFLKKETPTAVLYSENNPSGLEDDLVWAVDSLDGTSNYRMGVPLFLTQICLLEKGEPIVAVLYNPVLKQEYSAKKDGGAFLNGNRIFANDVSRLEDAVFVQDKGLANINKTAWYMALLGNHVRTVRVFGGCMGTALSLLAAGNCEIVLNPGAKPYDFIPGALLAREAGAVVADIKGNQWSAPSETLLAGNKHLAPKVLDIIRQASTF